MSLTVCSGFRLRAATLAFLTTAFLAAASAQQVTMNGPIEGFMYDAPTGSLRAIVGMPGSATFGPALVGGLDFGSVAPRHSHAVGLQAGSCLVISGLDSSVASAPIAGVPAGAENIAWSADGSVALIYSQSANWIQAITGLPQAPTLGSYVDTSALGGPLTAVAVNSDGSKIAVGIGGASGSVFLIADNQPAAPVLQLSNVVGLSFSSDGNSLYALDASTPQLAAVDLNSSAVVNLPIDGLLQPLSIEASQDAASHPVLYVASGTDQVIRAIDMASQDKTDFLLNAPPSEVVPLGASSFVVSQRSGSAQPLWLFTTSPQPASYFVPAIQAGDGGLR